MTRRVPAAVAACLALIGLCSCVAPATSTASFESKAVRSANDALSSLETALLTVNTSLAGRVTQPYLEVMLSKSEDAFNSVQSTFDSIQPPDDPASDALRAQLDNLLSDGSDGLAELRILARRQDSTRLAVEARSLEPTATLLNAFAQDHG